MLHSPRIHGRHVLNCAPTWSAARPRLVDTMSADESSAEQRGIASVEPEAHRRVSSGGFSLDTGGLSIESSQPSGNHECTPTDRRSIRPQTACLMESQLSFGAGRGKRGWQASLRAPRTIVCEILFVKPPCPSAIMVCGSANGLNVVLSYTHRPCLPPPSRRSHRADDRR